MNGYVYFGILEEEILKKVINNFFKTQKAFQIIKDIDNFSFKENYTSDISKMGNIFSEKGELRWKEINKKSYETLLLTENIINDDFSEMVRINGNWEVKKYFYSLISLQARHISPQFKDYPKKANSLKMYIYYKNKIPIFVSPRGVIFIEKF